MIKDCLELFELAARNSVQISKELGQQNSRSGANFGGPKTCTTFFMTCSRLPYGGPKVFCGFMELCLRCRGVGVESSLHRS